MLGTVSVQLRVLSATLFVAMAGFSVVIPALGDLALRYGASSFEMGLLTAAYAVAQLVCAPVWGLLIDRIGCKPIVITGLVGFSLSFLLMGLAESFAGIMAGRVLGGILSAALLPSAQVFAARLSGSGGRSVALGRLAAAMALGFVLGPVLSVALLPLGIRAPFLFSLGLGLLVALAASLLLSEPQRIEEPRADPNAAGPLKWFRRGLLSSAAVWFWLAFIIMFGASSVFTLLVYFVEQQIQGTAFHASLVFAGFGAATALCSTFLLGPAVRRFGEIGTIRGALLIAVVGFVFFCAASDVVGLCAAGALVGSGMALSRPAIASLAMEEASLGHGATMGIQGSFDALGRILGPLGAGLLYTWSPRAPFFFSAAISAAGLVLVFMSRRSRARSLPAVQAEVPEVVHDDPLKEKTNGQAGRAE